MIPARSRRRRGLSFILKAAVAGGILAVIFHHVPIARVIEAMGEANVPAVIGACLLALLATVLSAARLRIAGRRQGIDLPVSSISAINLVAGFYGLFLPGYIAGGAIRWHRLSRLGEGRPGILAAMVYSRLNFLVVLMLLGVVFLLVDLSPPNRGATILGLLALLSGALAMDYLAFRGTLLRVLDRRRRRGAPRRRWRALAVAGRRVRDVLRTAGHYRRVPLRDRIFVWLVSLAENALGVLSLWLLSLALDLDLRFASTGWIRSVVQLLVSLPITIAGLGVSQGGLLVLLEPFGVSAPRTLALSFLMLARTVFLAAIGGSIEAWRVLGRRR